MLRNLIVETKLGSIRRDSKVLTGTVTGKSINVVGRENDHETRPLGYSQSRRGFRAARQIHGCKQGLGIGPGKQSSPRTTEP